MSRTLIRRAGALALAPALTVSLATATVAPAQAETTAQTETENTNSTPKDKKMATGPGSSEYTQDEVDNAGRFVALLVGAAAIIATLGAAGLYFAGPHFGINLPGLPR
ncbi:hypothetical protein HMPREF3145_08825 [Corynebacterium sp. HMSC05C01]|uniref:Secreted protein n=1 Tax=Corynebacterium coyleae TaxID=53374 RepID=A0AAP6XMR4_9CORY|nr:MULTISPECIES: hypothetical protein [Corynebacterium]MDK8824285.1 hypothetical protein [Corynebacterium coyleae]NJJ03837.1 hypothetical protein [Corynebacterium coyleae]OFL16928.1 hypothetical protein HMPREF2785_08115 [Corynebacterium sp. HMSC067D03]OFL92181.1 hypothetical protein HMPREF2734_08640 [Corynebacterium sp. HMSC055D05]OFT68661.1 hypothetical protein HMPREF3145_08825 [Corynebacterium sp. HMSC05C01]